MCICRSTDAICLSECMSPTRSANFSRCSNSFTRTPLPYSTLSFSLSPYSHSLILFLFPAPYSPSLPLHPGALEVLLSLASRFPLVFCSAVISNDLYSFDPANMSWSLLSAAPGSNPPPSARAGHGFTSAGGKLYVHGGEGADTGTVNTSSPSGSITWTVDIRYNLFPSNGARYIRR